MTMMTQTPLAQNASHDLAKTTPEKNKPTIRPTAYIGRLALTDLVRRDAYALRYRSYLAGGYIQPNPSQLFSDIYDDMPNSRTVVIYQGEVPVASVRTCLLSHGTEMTSPALQTFPEEVRKLLSKGDDNPFSGRGIETNRLVRSPEAENHQGLVFLLFRVAAYVAISSHSQVHLACSRINHAPFYKRMGYEVASDPRPYPGLNCEMRLLESDRQRLDTVRQIFPVIDPLGATTGNLAGFFKGEPFSLSLGGV